VTVAPLVVVVEDMDGGEDDITPGEDDEVTANGRVPGSDAVSTFRGHGKTLYTPIVAFPCLSTDKSCSAMLRSKNCVC
jgi:hypothetical protein